MKTIVLDMYGVIIKESKGKFIPYTLEHFPKSEHERLIKQLIEDKLFTRAGNGEITSEEFLLELGFSNPQHHMQDYIEHYLTIDESFYTFAEKLKEKYDFVLLSNDILEWSKYITKYYKLDAYFSMKIVSAEVRCRKPEMTIFQKALEYIGKSAEECFFVDNGVENLRTAKKAGMDTILFNRDTVEYDGKTVYSFDELYQLLQ